MKTTLKNIGAVILGFLASMVLSFGTSFIFSKLGVFPPDESNFSAYPVWYLVFSIVYQGAYFMLGAYLTSKLAPSYRGAIIALVILSELVSIAALVTGWSGGAHWFLILLMITNPLGVWVGGGLGKKKQIKQ